MRNEDKRHYERERKLPIRSWFVMDRVSDFPPFMGEQLIDVPLPIRYPRPTEGPDSAQGEGIITEEIVRLEDAVCIMADDMVKALRLFDRTPAADWCEDHHQRQRLRPAGHSGFGIDVRSGKLLPNDLAQMLYPNIEGFDKWEI